ncbi:MAG TPA: SIS domain-containing protein [Dongiaceae bacterium]|nr:SIS domain-containing protein [Dongiaceae bacterium]
MTASSLMQAEALEAPSIVARMLEANRDRCKALVERLRKSPPPFAVTCARGSSDNAGTYAKYLLEIRMRLVTASVGPSISSVFGVAPAMKGALLLAISQSGRSPDLLSLAEAGRQAGALSVAIVNDTDSPLAKMAEVMLPLLAGPERSVAATKSYIASLAAILQLVAHWSEDPALLDAVENLPEQLGAAARLDWSAAEAVLRNARSLFVVGRGPGFGIAQEAALKLKEICGLHAEAMSSAELMHGPLALPGADFPVLAFLQPDPTEAGMVKVLRSLSGRGVPVAAAGSEDKSAGTVLLPSVAGVHPFAAPILLIQTFYLLAEKLAWARGRDPDRPPHLKKVTETR